MLSKRDLFFERLHFHVLCWSKQDQSNLPKHNSVCVFLFHVKLCRTMPVRYSDQRSGDQKGPTNQIFHHGGWKILVAWDLTNTSKESQINWSLAGRRLSCTSWKHSNLILSLRLVQMKSSPQSVILTHLHGRCLLVPSWTLWQGLCHFFARHSEDWFLWHVGTNLTVNMCNTTR